MLKHAALTATSGLILLACALQTSTPDPLDWYRIRCDELHEPITKMSQDSHPEILKFLGGIRTGRTSDRLDCWGEVRTTQGKFFISYYLEKDPDGEQFIGYKLEHP